MLSEQCPVCVLSDSLDIVYINNQEGLIRMLVCSDYFGHCLYFVLNFRKSPPSPNCKLRAFSHVTHRKYLPVAFDS